MTIKKSIIWILLIVLLLTVVSGVVLYSGGNRSGGITSVQDTKYDYVVDNSYAHVKDVYAGARNGELKTVGSVCYEYSKILLNVTPNQTVSGAPSQIVDPSNKTLYTFYLEMPMEITITSTGATNYNVYLCWQSDAGDPEDPIYRHYVGSGSNHVIDDLPAGYGSEQCWIEIDSPNGNVVIKRIVVQMVPYADSSAVTEVIATSKNLIDYRGATLRDGKTPLSIVDNGVIMPAGETYYIVIPISDLPINNYYTVSYKGTNELGESVGKYAIHYTDGSYVSYNNGVGAYHTSKIDAIWIYKSDPGKDNELQADLTITNIQLEVGLTATEYTPWFEDRTILTVPDAILNLPGYGVGSYYGLYNYLDLSNGTYIQTCKLVDGDIVALDEPKVMDVSHYLPPGCGKIDLYGVGTLIYVNYYNLDVPSELTYRRIIN